MESPQSESTPRRLTLMGTQQQQRDMLVFFELNGDDTTKMGPIFTKCSLVEKLGLNLIIFSLN